MLQTFPFDSSSTPREIKSHAGAPAELPLARVDMLVAHEFSVSLQDLHGKTRGRAVIAHARQVAIYLAHVGLGIPLSRLARHYHRDRTTIMHACRVIENARDNYGFDDQMTGLEGKLRTLIPGSAV